MLTNKRNICYTALHTSVTDRPLNVLCDYINAGHHLSAKWTSSMCHAADVQLSTQYWQLLDTNFKQ